MYICAYYMYMYMYDVYIYIYYIHINICHIVLHRLEACIYHLLSNMASKKDEKTFKALMKNIKLLMPPKSMKTCHRFFKARAKMWVRAIVQGNMHIDNVWARWSDTYDAITRGQWKGKGKSINGRSTDALFAEQTRATSIMKQAFLATVFPIRYCPQCGVKLSSPCATRTNYCTQCGIKFPEKHCTCNRCGAQFL